MDRLLDWLAKEPARGWPGGQLISAPNDVGGSGKVGTMLYRIGLLVLMCVLLSVASDALPQTSNVVAPLQCGKYEKFEASFGVTTSAANYNWPYDTSPPVGIESGVGVSVDGLFSNDNWATTLLKPGFYYQKYEYVNRVGFGEWLYPTGNPSWCVRFSPFETGVWKYKLRVTDKEGTAYSNEMKFTCVASAKHGPLKVSSTDSRYFEHTDGEPWVCGIGLVDSDYGDLSKLETDLPDWGSNGVNLIRTWWQSYSRPLLFGYDRNLKLPTSAEHAPGRQLSWKLGNSYPANEFTIDVFAKQNTNYRVSARVKTDSITTSEGGGVVIYAYSLDKQWGAVTQSLAGTNDWMEISVVINSYNNYQLHTKMVVDKCTSGSVWLSDVSIREDLGGGNYGPELVEMPNPEVYRNVRQMTASKCEKMLELCEVNNVWLKIVAEEKQDPVYSRIMADGSYDEAHNPDGTSMYSSATSANRRYQEYYWRFLAARFGHSPAVHSWELFNEADPYNGNHYLLANAFAKYMHDNNPNKQLVTTSNWHSYPTAEFWSNPTYSDIDYSDLHKYTHAQNDYSGLLVNVNYAAKIVGEGAPAVVSSGHSFRITATDPEHAFRKLPVTPGHSYKISVYSKADNIVWKGGGSNAAKAAFWIREYTGWMADQNGFHDTATPSTKTDPLTYNWTQYSITINTKATTRFLSLSVHVINASSGTAWYDSITMEDLTDGKNIEVPNGCFEHVDPICWDSALETYEVGAMYLGLENERHKSAPLIRGETGISDALNNDDESPLLFNDTANLWFKKKVWAQIGPTGVIDIPWWREKLDPTRRWAAAKSYYEFLSGIPINNGHYEHVDAVCSVAALRAWGQKDLTNNRAHLWIDNAPYTWKAVLDHDYPPLTWAAAWTFPVSNLCSSGTPLHVYKSLQANNKNHLVTDAAWWQDMGAYNAANNPALPPPVTGNVTIRGLKDGKYKVEWWNTSTGIVTKTEELNCAGGNLVLSVSNLQSDIACKIAPVGAKIVVNLTVPSLQVIPDQIVTVTLHYTNPGETEAKNAAVTGRVPAQMTYVAGSAEASGGSYDAGTGVVTWIVDSVTPHQTGTRTFQATVQ